MDYYELINSLRAGAQARKLDMQCKIVQKRLASMGESEDKEKAQNDLARLRAQQKNAQTAFLSATKILFTLYENELRANYSLIKENGFEVNVPTFGEYRNRVAEFLVWNDCEAIKGFESRLDSTSLVELLKSAFHQVAQTMSDECRCIQILSSGREEAAKKIEKVVSPLVTGANPVISVNEIPTYYPEHKNGESMSDICRNFIHDIACNTYDCLLAPQKNGHSAIENFKYGAPLESYIYEVAKNMILHTKTSAYNRGKTDLGVQTDKDGHAQERINNIPQQSEKDEAPFSLEDILVKFAPKDQIFIRRAFIEDLPTSVVCEELEISQPTYYRIQKRLKTELAILLIEYR